MERFTKPEWNSEKTIFECVQNGFGQWWPKMATRKYVGDPYPYEIIIRNSNPFKTLNGAIKFVEKTMARIEKRNQNKNEVS